MRNALILAQKETAALFVSSVAYVVLTGFLLLGGWFFFNLLFRFNALLTLYVNLQNLEAMQALNLNEYVIAPLLHNLTIILIILVPVITMRAFSEKNAAGPMNCYSRHLSP